MSHASCFGLPSVFNAGTQTCMACASRSECVSACYSMLVSLSDKIDVTAPLAQLERTAKVVTAQSIPAPVVATTIAAPAPAAVQVNLEHGARENELLATLPVRVQKVMRPLLKRGGDARARLALAKGLNPFDGRGPQWLRLAGEKLLAGGFTKGDLRRAYINEYGWSEATAFSRVSIVVSLIPALRLGRVSGDTVLRGPSFARDH
jgi:hypothetical protein